MNRASLYGTFGDKAQLFRTVLDRYRAQVQDEFTAQLGPPHAGKEAIARFLSRLVALATQPTKPRGCLFVNTTASCVTAPREMVDGVKAAVLGTQTALHAALRRDPALARRKDLRALAQRDGASCREFLMSFVRDSEESWLQGEACRKGRSGAWKVDQARLLQRT